MSTEPKSLKQEFLEIATAVWPDGTPEKKCALPHKRRKEFERMFYTGARVALTRVMRSSYFDEETASKQLDSLFAEIEAETKMNEADDGEENDRN